MGGGGSGHPDKDIQFWPWETGIMDWTERQMVITRWAGEMEAVARNLRYGADDNHRKGLDYAIESALDVWGDKGRIPDDLRAALYGDDADDR